MPQILDTCSQGHENIAFVGYNCPLCLQIQFTNNSEKALSEAEEVIKALETTLNLWKTKVESYEEDYQRWKTVVDKLEGRTYE